MVQRFAAEVGQRLKLGRNGKSSTKRHNKWVKGVVALCIKAGIPAHAEFPIDFGKGDIRRADALVAGTNLYEFKSRDSKGEDFVQIQGYLAHLHCKNDVRLSAVLTLAADGRVRCHHVSPEPETRNPKP